MEQLLHRQDVTRTMNATKFYITEQGHEENIDAYSFSLRTLADTYSFGALKDEMTRERLVYGISDNGLRRKLLQESELTLEKCMDYCKLAEAAKNQLKEISNHGAEVVHQLSNYKKERPMKESKESKYCGRKHELGWKNAQRMARPVVSV